MSSPPPPAPVGVWLDRAERHFIEHDVPESAANAEFLMAAVLGVGRAQLEFRRLRALDGRRARIFWDWVQRRSRRVPLAYVLGMQPFLGLDLRVGPGVLIPRPETEELAELSIRLAKELLAEGRRWLKILDIGAGSGCIALSLAKAMPQAEVAAIEPSRKAMAYAKANARICNLVSRVMFVPSERTLKPQWHPDLIVSNPPYIPTARLRRLEAEVLKEPRLALDGGKDGLTVIRSVIRTASRRLKPGGWLALEIDSRQGRRVPELLRRAGFERLEIRRDAQRMVRFVLARRPVTPD